MKKVQIKSLISKSIQKGIVFLSRNQEKDGSFLSYSTANPKNFKKSLIYKSVFPSALILSALSGLKDGIAGKVKAKLAKFLLSQKSSHWSFNYWVRNSGESKKMPYPDDLDDTFCALSALSLYDPNIISPDSMALVVGVLTALEEKEGGPYRTWLVGPDASKTWKDVDLAVNANIAFFLKLNEVSLPDLNDFIENKIIKCECVSPYYPSTLPIAYFISRFYKGRHKEKIIKYLLNRESPRGGWRNPLDTALAVSALLNLGVEEVSLRKAINYLLKTQKRGGWEAGAFCLDPALDKKKYYAGSTALTTGFVVEALAKYLSVLRPEIREQMNSKETLENSKALKMSDQIINRAQKRFIDFPLDFREFLLKNLASNIASKNGREILLLPYFFRESLKNGRRKVSDELIIKLGLANLYGWAAYTIYDNFLDDEGDKKSLSIANIFLRELTVTFDDLDSPVNLAIRRFYRRLMDQMEAANYWEVVNCRGEVLPEYNNISKLSDRSLPHALGPIAILLHLGFKEDSKEVRSLLCFFQNYLAAKQLDDEAHDWEEDYKKGHLTSVVVKILKSSRERISLEEMQRLFWGGIIRDIAQEILGLALEARQSLKILDRVIEIRPLVGLIEKVEASANKTLKEQSEIGSFLAAYERGC